MAMTMENPNEEAIKCVIVGDNNAGKTRLVCARAYKQYRPNHKPCLGTHIPTVWANDHYRNDPNVLLNSRENIDGVNVSLRLWDTFGDHSKNRIFAYQNADVVLLCFSICDPKSLKNIVTFWIPEVRKHCKRVPVILIGCKVDFRFMNLDELNRKKSPLVRKITWDDILLPEKCRYTAYDIGCPYYEVSATGGIGVEETFQNVARAALICRRNKYFYRNIQLRRVQKPILQKPSKPPKPEPPQPPEHNEYKYLKIGCLFNNPSCSDLVLTGKNFSLHAHKVVLFSASAFFRYVLTTPQQRCSSPVEDINKNDETVFIFSELSKQNPFVETCLEFDDLVEPYDGGNVMTFNPDISGFAIRNLIYFMYTSHLPDEISNSGWVNDNVQVYHDMIQAGKRFGMHRFVELLELIWRGDCGMEVKMEDYDDHKRNILCKNVLFSDRFSDIIFEADDGTVPGHKALLMCGSEMMNAMFGSNYIESGNENVSFPETTVESLRTLFEYIYLRRIHSTFDSSSSYNEAIALANRLCLPDLVSLLETRFVNELRKQSSEGLTRELHETVIEALQIAQFHNAFYLVEWCLHYLSVNYDDVCQKCKAIKTLSKENLNKLQRRRWPPVWFIKEYDAYERACRERMMNENDPKSRSLRK